MSKPITIKEPVIIYQFKMLSDGTIKNSRYTSGIPSSI